MLSSLPSLPSINTSRDSAVLVSRNSVPEVNDNKEYQDCLPCKLTGAFAFSGLAGYSFYQAYFSPTAISLTKTRKFGIVSLGLGFASFAIARILN